MRTVNQIVCAAELESLPVFRKFVDNVCKQKLDDSTCYDLKLGVDEACTNIITHGYAGMNPGSIMLKVKLDEDKIIIKITDFGHPFEPYQPEKPDVVDGLEKTHQSGVRYPIPTYLRYSPEVAFSLPLSDIFKPEELGRLKKR